MKKIPVGATIAQSYNFTFRHFLKILGIAWLPWAIMTSGILALIHFAPATVTLDPAAAQHRLLTTIPIIVLTLFAVAMQVTGITELALGLKSGSPYYYFSIGKPFWRMIGACFLLVAIAIVCTIAVILIDVFLTLAAHIAAPAINGEKILPMMIGLTLFAGVTYAIIRFGYLLPPSIITEEKIDLKSNWLLTRGNGLRIFAVWMAATIPFLALEVAYWLLIARGMPAIPPHPTPEQAAAFEHSFAVWSNEGNRPIISYVSEALFLAMTALYLGTFTGSQIFAYRALTGATDPTSNRP